MAALKGERYIKESNTTSHESKSFFKSFLHVRKRQFNPAQDSIWIEDTTALGASIACQVVVHDRRPGLAAAGQCASQGGSYQAKLPTLQSMRLELEVYWTN